MARHNHKIGIDPGNLEKVIRRPRVRRTIAAACHFWFFNIYFPHYVKYETAPFQKELFGITEDETIRNVVIEAFRGSAKTTIMSTSYAIWSILGCQQKKFVLILAQTQEQARQYLASIKMELEANALLRRDLGPFEEPDDEWRSISIVIPKYGARITVASIDKPVRGLRHGEHRPDIIICDDLEDLDTVRTQEERDKVYNWLMGDVIPLGDKRTRLIVIGTRLHDDSIIARLTRAVREGTMDGSAKSYPLLDARGRSAWPGKYRNKRAVADFRKSVPSAVAWEREYMLRIIAEEEQVVRPEWIHYYGEFPGDDTELRFAAMGVDPAIAESETSDYTAIVSAKVYGSGNSLIVYILPHPVNERLNFPTALERIKMAAGALGGDIPPRIYVEDVAYQRALIDQLRSEGFPVEEFKPQGADKRARLAIVSHLIQSGKVRFPREGAELLVRQITGFGSERRDDLADAFSTLLLKIKAGELSLEGAYYHNEVQALRESVRIGNFPLLLGVKVHAVWDIGESQTIAIGFYQKRGDDVWMVDYWEGKGTEGIDAAIAAIKSRPYLYGEHFAPQEFLERTAYIQESRLRTARRAGIQFRPIFHASMGESITAGKRLLVRLWVNMARCAKWLDKIDRHKMRWEGKRQMFKEQPFVDQTIHAANVHRYAALVVDKMEGFYDGPEPPHKPIVLDPYQ